jgi:tellurite resistance protein
MIQIEVGDLAKKVDELIPDWRKKAAGYTKELKKLRKFSTEEQNGVSAPK